MIVRIDALARRASTDPRAELCFGELTIDTVERKVFHAGRYISLTRSEFLLLEELVEHAGQPLPRKTLEQSVWGAEAQVSRGMLDTLVHSLRAKLDAQVRSPLIKTIRSLGYCLESPPGLAGKLNP